MQEQAENITLRWSSRLLETSDVDRNTLSDVTPDGQSGRLRHYLDARDLLS
jgi:hypothetical protein